MRVHLKNLFFNVFSQVKQGQSSRVPSSKVACRCLKPLKIMCHDMPFSKGMNKGIWHTSYIYHKRSSWSTDLPTSVSCGLKKFGVQKTTNARAAGLSESGPGNYYTSLSRDPVVPSQVRLDPTLAPTLITVAPISTCPVPAPGRLERRRNVTWGDSSLTSRGYPSFESIGWV